MTFSFETPNIVGCLRDAITKATTVQIKNYAFKLVDIGILTRSSEDSRVTLTILKTIRDISIKLRVP